MKKQMCKQCEKEVIMSFMYQEKQPGLVILEIFYDKKYKELTHRLLQGGVSVIPGIGKLDNSVEDYLIDLELTKGLYIVYYNHIEVTEIHDGTYISHPVYSVLSVQKIKKKDLKRFGL
jgi:hypothetical protein